MNPPCYSGRVRGNTPQFGSLNRHHWSHIQYRSPPSEPHTASEIDSDSYQFEPTLFTAPSSPMAGVHPDPFQGGIVSSGITSIPPIIIGIPSPGPIRLSPSGTLVTAHTDTDSLPISGGPIPTTIVTTITPFKPGGSGPSTLVPTIPIVTVTFLLLEVNLIHPYLCMGTTFLLPLTP